MKKKTISEKREDCRNKGKVYDTTTGHCRNSKRKSKRTPSKSVRKSKSKKTISEKREDCRNKGKVYNTTTERCRNSKRKSKRTSSKRTSSKRTSSKRTSSKRTSSKRTSSKRTSSKRTSSKKSSDNCINLTIHGDIPSIRKKYENRPGPSYAAQSCKNKKKKGNDGKLYESLPNKNNIYTWRKIKK